MEIRVDLLHYEFEQAGLPVSGVSSDGRFQWSRKLTAQEETLAESIVAAHDPKGLLPREANRKDAIARFKASAIADKTPAEIYTIVQSQIDGWTSLANAKADLRKWLPMAFALITQIIGNEEEE
jgi:hypothetical protein